MFPRRCVPGYFRLVPTGPETVAALLQVISIQALRDRSCQDFHDVTRAGTITQSLRDNNRGNSFRERLTQPKSADL